MTETTPRREATRQRLVVAAITEFAARGIDATSVEQLCDAAGFTRGAFYSNFATKDDLCVAILEHHRDVVQAGLARTFDTLPDDARVEWATGAALSMLFSIIAPTEEFRITLMEIRLRALRVPELAARSDRLAAEFRPALIHLIVRLSDRFGVRLKLPLEDVLDLFEAMYFQLDTRGTRGAEHLLGAVVLALSEPMTAADG